MGPGLALDGPSDPQQRSQNALRLGRGPRVHAAAKTPAISRGSGSPFSNRSAMTRSANAMALVRASASLMPYASTPGRAGTSAIQRPLSSRSLSIFSMMRCVLDGIQAIRKQGLGQGTADEANYRHNIRRTTPSNVETQS